LAGQKCRVFNEWNLRGFRFSTGKRSNISWREPCVWTQSGQEREPIDLTESACAILTHYLVGQRSGCWTIRIWASGNRKSPGQLF
jgi:hypothetical protein